MLGSFEGEYYFFLESSYTNENSRSESNVLQEQRELIQTLIEEKRLNDKRFRQLTESLESSSFSNDEILQGNRESPIGSTSIHIQAGRSGNSTELSKYCKLIVRMLSDVDKCKSDLKSDRHSRIATGILDLHEVEARHFEFSHGPNTVRWIKNCVSSLYHQFVFDHSFAVRVTDRSRAGLTAPPYVAWSDTEEYTSDYDTRREEKKEEMTLVKHKEFRERLKCEFGYTEEEIEQVLARRKEREEKEKTMLVKHKDYEKTTWIKVCMPVWYSAVARSDFTGPSPTSPARDVDGFPFALGLGRCK